MTTVTIVIQNPPYQENNKAWHALRFAGAALAEDMRVRVHLLDDAVERLGVAVTRYRKARSISRRCSANSLSAVWK